MVDSRGEVITIDEILGSASRQIAHDLQSQPATRARLLATLGTVYGNLGKFTEAETALRPALEVRQQIYAAREPEIADAQRRLGSVLIEREQQDEAERLLEAALEISIDTYGRNSSEVALTLHKLARLRQLQ